MGELPEIPRGTDAYERDGHRVCDRHASRFMAATPKDSKKVPLRQTTQ